MKITGKYTLLMQYDCINVLGRLITDDGKFCYVIYYDVDDGCDLSYIVEIKQEFFEPPISGNIDTRTAIKESPFIAFHYGNIGINVEMQEVDVELIVQPAKFEELREECLPTADARLSDIMSFE